MLYERPRGKPAFTAPWLLWFASRLTLPEGTPFEIEGWFRLLVNELLAPGVVEVLCMLPKGQGKTTGVAALADWHALTVPSANAYIGAADRIQADEMYRFAAHYVESEPELESRLLVRRSTREVRSRTDQGFIHVLASDDSKTGGKRQGFNPTLALLDELHAHANDNLYTDMRTGLFKRHGKLCTITTAGYDHDSVLGRLRKQFLNIGAEGGTLSTGLVVRDDGSVYEDRERGRLTIARSASGRTLMLEWACRDDDDITDMGVVKLASPSKRVTVEALRDAYEAPGITPWAFARYFGNRWTLGYESWLPAGSWDTLADPKAGFDANLPIVAAVDMARYRDTAAVGIVQRRADGRKVVEAEVWESGGPDHPVSYDAVKDYLRQLNRNFTLLSVGYDPKYFDQSAEELTADGLPMEEFPQSNERMCPAAADLRREIIEGEFVHDGDVTLSRHMMAGKAQDVGDDQFKVVKSKKNGPPIDACVAVMMANVLEKVATPDVSAEWW